MVCYMVGVGEQAGNIEEMLERVAGPTTRRSTGDAEADLGPRAADHRAAGLSSSPASSSRSSCRCYGEEPLLDPDKATEGKVLDPWNNEYVYRVEGTSFEIVSYGEDGVQGGEGDAADISSKNNAK
jgi:hypothetical protein